MPRLDEGPGWKRGETSYQAAVSAAPKAATVRASILREMRAAGVPLTADEIAERIKLDRLSVRPRCSDLVNSGVIRGSGDYGFTASGRKAAKWEVVERP